MPEVGEINEAETSVQQRFAPIQGTASKISLPNKGVIIDDTFDTIQRGQIDAPMSEMSEVIDYASVAQGTPLRSATPIGAPELITAEQAPAVEHAIVYGELAQEKPAQTVKISSNVGSIESHKIEPKISIISGPATKLPEAQKVIVGEIPNPVNPIEHSSDEPRVAVVVGAAGKIVADGVFTQAEDVPTPPSQAASTENSQRVTPIVEHSRIESHPHVVIPENTVKSKPVAGTQWKPHEFMPQPNFGGKKPKKSTPRPESILGGGQCGGYIPADPTPEPEPAGPRGQQNTPPGGPELPIIPLVPGDADEQDPEHNPQDPQPEQHIQNEVEHPVQ